MYNVQYFENMIKKGKRQFTLYDIAKMQPSFIRPYMITGFINRVKFLSNLDKINQIRKRLMPHSKPFKGEQQEKWVLVKNII